MFTDNTQDNAARLQPNKGPIFWIFLTISLCLVGILFIILLQSALIIIRAGAETIGIVSLILPSLGAIFSLIPYMMKNTSPVFGNRPRLRWSAAIGLQIALLIVVLLFRDVIFESVGQEALSRAEQAESVDDAQSAIQTAATLNAPIHTWLDDEIDEALAENAPHRLDALAPILADYLEATEIVPLIQTAMQTALDTGQIDEAQGWGEILAYISPGIASQEAGRLNDLGAQAIDTEQLGLALAYLETVRSIDGIITRDPAAASASRLNLGQVYEKNAAIENHIGLAIEAYREAVALKDDNLDARYVLSVTLLIYRADDPDQLQQAANIAQQGRAYLPSRCEGEILLATSNASFDEKLLCFFFLTTEANARYALGEPIDSLIERAVLLAESNDQFGPMYFTAEAYYYQAWIGSQPPDKDDLCAILANDNENNERHEPWTDFAREQLQEHYPDEPCSSG